MNLPLTALRTARIGSEVRPARPAADRQVAYDPTLPGLTGALDPDQVRALLVAHGALPATAGLAVRYVRFHPGRGAWITYEATGGRLLYGRLDAPGNEPLAGHERDELDRRGAAGAPPTLVILPELLMVIRFFPHDAVLRRLADACAPSTLKRELEALLVGDGEEWKVRMANLEGAAVRYKPERRFVFRLRLRAHMRGARRKQRIGLYGQVDADGTGARVQPVLAALAAQAGATDPVAVPRPVLHAPQHGLLLVEEIAGTPLTDHLEREDAKKVLRRLAGRMADIQRSGVEPALTRGVREQMAALTAAQAMIGNVAEARAAGLAVHAGALVEVLGARAVAAPVTTLIHGDFHAGQVLVRGRRSWIVDFDRAALGDPLSDLGTFIAGLQVDVAEGRVARAPARRAAKAFLRGHAEAWPEIQDARRLAWHVAAALTEMAAAPLRQLRASWPELVRRRLDLAGNVLAGGEVLP